MTQSRANCSSETDGASIEVLAAPQFVEEPEDQALCLGGEALSFAVDYEQGTGSRLPVVFERDKLRLEFLLGSHERHVHATVQPLAGRGITAL